MLVPPRMLLTLALLATVGTACDDDDGDDMPYDAGAIPDGFEPGFDADQVLEELDRGEAMALCEGAVSWAQGRLTRDDEAVQATCIVAVATTQPELIDDEAACEAAVMTCKTGSFPNAEVCDDERGAIRKCGQTVQDYQDCLEENTLQFIETFKDVTCADLTTASFDMSTPEACEDLWDACPELDQRAPAVMPDAGMDEDAGM